MGIGVIMRMVVTAMSRRAVMVMVMAVGVMMVARRMRMTDGLLMMLVALIPRASAHGGTETLEKKARSDYHDNGTRYQA